MDGFGSELSLTAIALFITKSIVDIYMKRREKKRVVEGVNSSGNNPAKGATSTDLMLYRVKEHSEKLKEHSADIKEIGINMGKINVNLAKINTKLDVN
jgi:hypothetical protein